MKGITIFDSVTPPAALPERSSYQVLDDYSFAVDELAEPLSLAMC